MRPEVITILKSLDHKSQSAVTMEKKVLELLSEQQDLHLFIENLQRDIESTKDSHDDRVPFYQFYLAVVLLKQNSIEEAKDALSAAVHGFLILGWAQNQAMGEWLFSTIHYEKEDYDRAQRACERAIDILRSLIKQYDTESKYEHAKELSIYLMQLEIFQDGIITVADSSKSLLRDYKTKLENDIEYLKRQKKRVRPTVIAKVIYISKILTPAHSVYPKVPDPQSAREEKLYKELINKVGFFEIIAKLEAMEREFSPTATREEVLDRINSEWDKDVNQ
jgi:tetratricopeptide (TPR) repeat protein